MSNELKPKQTRPKRSEQLQVHCEPGELGYFIRHALDAYNQPPIDIRDISQVQGRCEWYFNHCIKNDIRPGLAGLCNAIGISRKTFLRWKTGEERKDTHQAYVCRVSAVLEELMEDYSQAGRINPVTAIFLMKNNYGYQDKSEVELSPKVSDPFGDPISQEELERKYLDVASMEVFQDDPED